MTSPSLSVALPAGAHPVVLAAGVIGILIVALAIAKFIEESTELRLETPAGTFVARRPSLPAGWS